MIGGKMPWHYQINRRKFLNSTVAAAFGLPLAGNIKAVSNFTDKNGGAEWRNKQSGMSYRKLGRTGLMISEVVSGGDPIRPDNYRHLELALDMGLNYLDMAPAYGRGKCEEAYGKLLRDKSKREKVFLTTKVSSFKGLRRRMYRDIYDALPGTKKETIQKRAEILRNERAVDKPGYYLTYYPGQKNAFNSAYLTVALSEQYAHKVEGSPEFQKNMFFSVEESLKRVGTDYFDLLMCPHGADAPEEVQIVEIFEAFSKLKQQGKVRYLGVTSHNDPAGILNAAADTGYYDVAMLAYNVINGGYLESPIKKATEKDMGIIGMKVAHAVATHHKKLQPVPEWRKQKVNRIVPGEMKVPMKAYLWALQNPHISAVVSNLWNESFVKENLSLAGKKVDLQEG
jgi:aryl-alcohol dehydrogenase-like predicted oxidoreductase